MERKEKEREGSPGLRFRCRGALVRRAPDRPGEGSRADPRAEPAPGPPPPLPPPCRRLRLPSCRPSPRHPRVYRIPTPPRARSLRRPSVGQSVRRTPLGTRHLLLRLPQRLLQPRSGPSPVPAPPPGPLHPGPPSAGRGRWPPPEATPPAPPLSPNPGDGRRGGGPCGGSGCRWWRPARTCRWQGLKDLCTAGVLAPLKVNQGVHTETTRPQAKITGPSQSPPKEPGRGRPGNASSRLAGKQKQSPVQEP